MFIFVYEMITFIGLIILLFIGFVHFVVQFAKAVIEVINMFRKKK